MTLPEGLANLDCTRIDVKGKRPLTDVVAVEERITLEHPPHPPVTLWANPVDLEDLAVGHVLVDLDQAGLDVRIERREGFAFHLVSSPPQSRPPVKPFSLKAEDLPRIMREFLDAPGRFEATGSFHRAGVYDPEAGRFIFFAEDVGRHNCIDRARGRLARMGKNPASRALFVTARATGSLVEKIGRAGFPVIVSRSAVTTAGVAVAAELGISLAGFARIDRVSVFTDQSGRFRD